MSSIKIGDRGYCRGGCGLLAEVTAIDRFGTLIIRYGDGSFTAIKSSEFTPVLAFFEAGKTYQHQFNADWKFACDYVGKADGGYAVGEAVGRDGRLLLLRLDDFDGWEES